MTWLWILLGAVLAAPLWIGVTLMLCRRLWRSVRRMTARSRGREQLIELGQLAGGLAHEIKNPLSTINLNLRLLNEDIDRLPDEQHQRWSKRLRTVQEEAGRLREILDDFLRFAGKYELQCRAVDLRELVSELTDFYSAQADSAHVVLRTHLSEEPVVACVDENLIKQALLNLMVNATQAMTEGGELLVCVRRKAREAVLEVTDTGPGIDEENRAKIFQVYYSTKSGGTGLGLPTTRRIIREHGGSIRVDSECGKGTQFTILLPLDGPETAEPPDRPGRES
jgi:signal transduction histidine kinase